MHRIRIAFAAAFLGFLTLSAHAAVDSPVRRAFNVAAGGTLYLDTDVGKVHVMPGAGGVVVAVQRHAWSQKALDRVHLTMTQQGNDVHVRAEVDSMSRWFSWGNDLDMTFDVTVPARYNVELKTSGGSVSVGDLQGFVHARTSGGSVHLAHIAGPVDARTSGGDVHLSGAGGNAELHTSGGSLVIGRVGGTLLARTSGGSITVEDVHGAIDAETSGGSISASISAQPRGDSRLSTSGGSINVALAPTIAVDLDAHTSGGGVHSDLPITVMGKISDDALTGKVNGGGPRLVLHSSGGGIHVRRL
ncbi:MAG TPA: DUF4097 family beta strand repeat-containing protein [Thermoanaerobaculia bacterium]|nr:DUF4097 family beta strand repeat-containing protein [Thermoanaerobaculia bacterium]